MCFICGEGELVPSKTMVIQRKPTPGRVVAKCGPGWRDIRTGTFYNHHMVVRDDYVRCTNCGGTWQAVETEQSFVGPPAV